MNGYIPAPRATISAHRLWTNLWTRLGQAEDNCSQPGGNRKAASRRHGGVHSRGPAAGSPGTAAVDARTRADLRKHLMSPVSTDPMTTTILYFAEIPSTKQAARTLSRAGRWQIPRPGGSFL